MDDMNVGKLLDLLSGLTGITQSQNSYARVPYGGIPSHFSQAYGMQTGLLDNFVEGFFPFRQRMAPALTLQRDWDEMLRISNERSKMAGAIGGGMNPMAQRTMELALDAYYGRGQGATKLQEFRTSQPDLFKLGIMPLVNMISGPGVAMEKAMTYQDISRSFAGRDFATPTGMGRSSIGMPSDIAGAITSRLYGMAYKDDMGMFKRFSHFGVQDLGDIMRMGMDYGMQLPTYSSGDRAGQLDLNRTMEQVKGLAKTIEVGMAVFKTMDKEKVMENLMELHQGRIPITDTTSLESLLYKINAMAKRANISFDVMQRVSTEGAKLFEQLGLHGDIGGQLGAGTLLTTRLAMEGRIGESKISPMFTPAEVAQMGGQAVIRERYLTMLGSYASSENIKDMGALYQIAKERPDLMGGRKPEDIIAAVQRGDRPGTDFMPGGKQDILNKLRDQYVKEGFNKDISIQMAESQYQQYESSGRNLLIKDMTTQFGPMAMSKSGAKGLLADLSRVTGTQIDVSRLQTDKGYAAAITNLSLRYFQKQFNASPEEALNYAKQFIGTLKTPDEVLKLEFDRTKVEEIVSRQAQESASRTDIFGKIKQAFAFKKDLPEIQQALWETMKLSMPGTYYGGFDNPEQSNKNMIQTDLNNWIKGMSKEDIINRTIANLDKTGILKATQGVLSEFSGFDRYALTQRQNLSILQAATKEKRVDEEVIKKRFGTTEEAQKIFTDKGFNFRTFLDEVNRKKREESLPEISIKQALDDASLMEEFSNLSSFIKKSDKRYGTYFSDYETLQKISKERYGGKLFGYDFGEAAKSVMGEDYQKYYSSTYEILTEKDENKKEFFVSSQEAAVKQAMALYDKNQKETKEDRRRLFRITSQDVIENPQRYFSKLSDLVGTQRDAFSQEVQKQGDSLYGDIIKSKSAADVQQVFSKILGKEELSSIPGAQENIKKLYNIVQAGDEGRAKQIISEIIKSGELSVSSRNQKTFEELFGGIKSKDEKKVQQALSELLGKDELATLPQAQEKIKSLISQLDPTKNKAMVSELEAMAKPELFSKDIAEDTKKSVSILEGIKASIESAKKELADLKDTISDLNKIQARNSSTPK